MTRLRYGSRIGATALVRVECSAVIFDLDRHYILLTQRIDNGKWCLPGGTSKPGETVEETCIREVYTETGLEVQVTKLIGIYLIYYYNTSIT